MCLVSLKKGKFVKSGLDGGQYRNIKQNSK